ncbi:DUF2213 domain-containing protein [Frateuria aurantia]|uniref:Bacteriophage protein n=1 Tax=Frateuria aurantia (strain ATCC 33424 / DSM 6220 / KCTC 2777 / LMG 1558 / NBRC 3245 / NCIMB 13370) TaxID=767434 RepID=H8L666_FRAAD|nr:DUF2213 domain-containing protein [Frateuria aurantia]AFC85910.1 hypothetical protein Fraau_1489 [Frateuria aurantia DSM 6220]
MRFYTIQKLGPKRELTPEGFLLCLDVPVARTGEMIYGEGEVPIEGSMDGLIRITRTPDEVFRAETLASCQGKPITLDHPDEFVTPETSRTLSMGSMQNIRRGTGADEDVILADLLITDAEAIKAVQADGIEEVSLGYEADYEQTEPGRGVQRNIIVNHCALVRYGRCGPRCAIGDKETVMAKPVKPGKKLSFSDRLRRAFMSKDADEAEKLAQEAEDAAEEEEQKRRESEDSGDDDDGDDGKGRDKVGDTATLKLLRSMDKRLKSLDERMCKMEDAEGDGEEEEEAETNDAGDLTSAEASPKVDLDGVKIYTGDARTQFRQRLEIVSPGAKMPTFDAKTTDAAIAAKLCACQRRALGDAMKTDGGLSAVSPFLGGLDPQTAPMAVVNAAFTGAAELLRRRNNDHGSMSLPNQRQMPNSIADINKRSQAYWADRAAR